MKKLSNDQIYQLLHIINHNGNLRRLIRKEVTFMQIIDSVKLLTKEGILSFNEGELSLTENGKKMFEQLSNEYKSIDKDKWIEKETKSKLENKIEIDFVYLPNQNELYF